MKKRQKNKRRRIVGAVMIGAAAFAAFIVLGIFCIVKSGEKQLQEPGQYEPENTGEPLPEASEILWNGDVYAYREGIVNILCLGIDGRGKAEENTAFGFGPRADCIYLAVLDTENKSVTLLNISRDSIAKLRFIDSLGRDVGMYEMQLGLQYTMGDGLDSSCCLMGEAVSRLLNGIPIHGYCALYWNGIGEIHDAVGTVTVNVPEYLSELDSKAFPVSGMTELTSNQAMVYVQGRDIKAAGSDELRCERQQEYLQALLRKLKAELRRSPLLAVDIKEAVSDYLVTDLSLTEQVALASWAVSWDIEELDIRSLEGEIKQVPGFQDEFIVNLEKKMGLLTELFYDKRY